MHLNEAEAREALRRSLLLRAYMAAHDTALALIDSLTATNATLRQLILAYQDDAMKAEQQRANDAAAMGHMEAIIKKDKRKNFWKNTGLGTAAALIVGLTILSTLQ